MLGLVSGSLAVPIHGHGRDNNSLEIFQAGGFFIGNSPPEEKEPKSEPLVFACSPLRKLPQ